jgi:hypothetical protein
MSRMPADDCAVIPQKRRDPRELQNVGGEEIFNSYLGRPRFAPNGSLVDNDVL